MREATNPIAVMLDFGSHRHGAIGDPFIFELLAGVYEALLVEKLMQRIDGGRPLPVMLPTGIVVRET